MKYGIYDLRDHCWLGNDKGPRLFGEGDTVGGKVVDTAQAHGLARISAQMTAVQMGYRPDRLVAKPYDDSGNTLKDEVKTEMSAEEALRLIERGHL